MGSEKPRTTKGTTYKGKGFTIETNTQQEAGTSSSSKESLNRFSAIASIENECLDENENGAIKVPDEEKVVETQLDVLNHEQQQDDAKNNENESNEWENSEDEQVSDGETLLEDGVADQLKMKMPECIDSINLGDKHTTTETMNQLQPETTQNVNQECSKNRSGNQCAHLLSGYAQTGSPVPTIYFVPPNWLIGQNDYYKKIIICIPIAICRLVVFGLSLAVGYIVTKFALHGWKDKKNPMPRWRCRVLWVTRMCTRCILFSFGYHWIRRKGRPAKREIAPIVVSNHVSYIDPIFFFYELFPTIVASESHDSIPFVGTIIRAMQVIYVNRFSPSSRKDAVSEIKRKASCDRFPRLLLFPEGTTTNGRVLISFQLGAFIPGYPIQPVVVRYPHIHFDQSWGDISLPKLMFRMFTQFHNFMEVEYLPVVYPLESKKETVVEFAGRTSYALADALNVVQTSHSYGDLMLLTKAAEFKQEKPSSYMVEMAKVESLLNISSLEAVEFLDKFLLMNPDSRGYVRIHNFLSVLRLPRCPLTEKIFKFIDLEKRGSITFRQFLFGSAHIRKERLFWPACELAFIECDVRGSGYILKQQLCNYIRPAMSEMSDEELHELFTLFDTDNDGKISKDNFLICLRKNPLLVALFSPGLIQTDVLEAGDERLKAVV
ncbi:Lysophospholipid acyltransferase lpeat2 [Thalictrum thalictroides]|uniref:Lysophospholipid acyltransferase lpeat2 n=1 Tax=Thalictrum thalictroides TaxID=46969 RepID=A0A7J6WDL3_THATH|nr:Lysophospholipid acyltransferase lpeat2 [Thalictrum thalictroides]